MNDQVEPSRDFERAFQVGSLTAEKLLEFFAAVECPVSLITRALEPDKRTYGLLIKPTSHALIDGFGLHYEIAVICSMHKEFQARTVDLRRLMEDQLVAGRLEKDLTIVVSDDALLCEKLEKLDSPTRIHIPLSSSSVLSALGSGCPSVKFRELLQSKLYARDAFDRTGPVEGREFFGRQKLLLDLMSQVAKGSSIGLYGLRKVGKTSIVRNLSDAARQKGIPYYFVHIDLLSAPPSNRSYVYLLWVIAQQLQAQVSNDATRPLGPRPFGRTSRLDEIKDVKAFEVGLDSNIRAVAKHLNERRGRIVVVIDEIELLFPLSDVRDGFVGYEDFLGYLRGLSQNNALSVIVVGVNPNISEAQFLGRGRRNPMYGFFSNRYAGPMSLDEVREMIKTLGRSSGVRFEGDAIDSLYAVTGGHPALTRKYCSSLIRDKKRPITVTTSDVDDARDRFLRDESSSFAEMVSVVKEYYPDEFGVLTKVALSDGLPAIEVNRQTRSHLEGYQLVTERDGKLYLKNDLMRDWFSGLTRAPSLPEAARYVASMPVDQEALSAALKTLEVQLRRFIRGRLVEKYGVKSDRRITMALGTGEAEAARARRDSSLRRFQPDRDVDQLDILEYVYIGDLLKIVCGPDWELFRPTFKGDKKKLDHAISVIAPARNELAHNREIPPRELLRAYLESTELLELIAKTGELALG